MRPRWMTLAVLCVGVVWLGSIIVIPMFYGRPESPAAFGDMFGAVNALFSGLAFVVLIAALMLQSQELRLQREELESTRKELAGQKEQLALQNQTLRKQTFENTFFRMLSLHQEMVNSLVFDDWSGTDRRVVGRDCFEEYYDTLRASYERVADARRDTNPTLLIEQAYVEFNEQYQSGLGHYFRNLYNLVKFVHLSEVPDSEKRLYTNVIRAQLSSHELLVLFYNCISGFGRDKFRPLVERYSLLKGLPRTQLIKQEHAAYYHVDAFGRQN